VGSHPEGISHCFPRLIFLPEGQRLQRAFMAPDSTSNYVKWFLTADFGLTVASIVTQASKQEGLAGKTSEGRFPLHIAKAEIVYFETNFSRVIS